MHIILHGMLGHFERHARYTENQLINGIMDWQVLLFMNMPDTLNKMEQIRFDNINYSCCKSRYDLGLYSYFSEDKYARESFLDNVSELKFDEHETWTQADREDEEAVKDFWGQMSQVFSSGEDEEGKDDGGQAAPVASGDAADEKENDPVDSLIKRMGKESTGKAISFGKSKKQGKTYKEVWQELVRMEEVPREEPDSIDPMFYHYGLELYGNVPLIEPKEVNESYAVKTLVLAIDTSGSCADETTMSKFWADIKKILQELVSEGIRGKIILIECDDEIQREECIELGEDIKKCEKEENMYGGGGTSFVPVFHRINEYQKEGKRVDGLIYFTDGWGSCIKERPEYPVYFIFPYKEEELETHLPEWIQKVYMN